MDLMVVPAKLVFGPCRDGDHSLCPGRVRTAVEAQRQVKQGNKIVWVSFMNPNGQITCPCKETLCFCTKAVHCLDCKNTSTQDVDPNSWSCIDQAACLVRQETRRRNNPILQTLKEIRVMTTTAPETTEGTTEGTTKPTKVKEGTCLVTGEKTKGGLFKPGMDARYVRDRVAEVIEGTVSETDQVERIKRDGVSETLQNKFVKSLANAREKAKRAKAAAEAKATEEQSAETSATEAVAEEAEATEG